VQQLIIFAQITPLNFHKLLTHFFTADYHNAIFHTQLAAGL